MGGSLGFSGGVPPFVLDMSSPTFSIPPLISGGHN